MNKVARAQKGDLAAAQLKQKMLGINVWIFTEPRQRPHCTGSLPMSQHAKSLTGHDLRFETCFILYNGAVLKKSVFKKNKKRFNVLEAWGVAKTIFGREKMFITWSSLRIFSPTMFGFVKIQP